LFFTVLHDLVQPETVYVGLDLYPDGQAVRKPASEADPIRTTGRPLPTNSAGAKIRRLPIEQ
jgi:hypothetical protein